MIPHKVEIGERYSDDSGWAKLVAIDSQEGRFYVSIEGGEFSASTEFLDWLIDALVEARRVVALESRSKT